MEKITDNIPEFFYDLIGIFIPGFYFYFCISLIYDQTKLSELFSFAFLNATVATIFIIYFVGHIIYTLSSFFVAKAINKMTGNPIASLLGGTKTELNKKFDSFFFIGVIDDKQGYLNKNVEKGIRKLTGDSAFLLSDPNTPKSFDNIPVAFEICRNYVMEKTIRRAGTIRKEQAYGEMSRGIVFVAFISIIWISTKQIFGDKVANFWYVLLFFIFSFLCFAFRYVQARRINPIFIYTTFCSIINEENHDNKNNKDEKKGVI